MPARHCSQCQDLWPTDPFPETKECPRCERATMWAQQADPEYTIEQVRAIRAAAKNAVTLPQLDVDTSPANLNRLEQYVKYGFDYEDAVRLAAATSVHYDSTGRAWTRARNHQVVKACLDAGWTHTQALEVFT